MRLIDPWERPRPRHVSMTYLQQGERERAVRLLVPVALGGLRSVRLLHAWCHRHTPGPRMAGPTLDHGKSHELRQPAEMHDTTVAQRHNRGTIRPPRRVPTAGLLLLPIIGSLIGPEPSTIELAPPQPAAQQS